MNEDQEYILKLLREWFSSKEEYFDDEIPSEVCIDGWFDLEELAKHLEYNLWENTIK